jgi:hypothetical protein
MHQGRTAVAANVLATANSLSMAVGIQFDGGLTAAYVEGRIITVSSIRLA